jgi:hypothetical protein
MLFTFLILLFLGSTQETRSNDGSSVNSTSLSVKEQLEMFIGYLVKGEHLSRTKRLVDKATIFETLRQYDSLFPSLKQQTIGNKLLKHEYLDVPLKSGVYHFSTAKIGHIIEQFEQLAKAETGGKEATETTDLPKRAQVALFVEELVRKNVVTVVDNVVAVEKIRNVLHSDNNLWPCLEVRVSGFSKRNIRILNFSFPKVFESRHATDEVRLLELQSQAQHNEFSQAQSPASGQSDREDEYCRTKARHR